MTGPTRGWWGMVCWNGLSPDQQEALVTDGTLEWGWRPWGTCPNPATLTIETQHDLAPGPRFYCGPCAIDFIKELPT